MIGLFHLKHYLFFGEQNLTERETSKEPSVCFPRRRRGFATALKFACLIRLRALHTFILLSVRNLYARKKA